MILTCGLVFWVSLEAHFLFTNVHIHSSKEKASFGKFGRLWIFWILVWKHGFMAWILALFLCPLHLLYKYMPWESITDKYTQPRERPKIAKKFLDVVKLERPDLARFNYFQALHQHPRSPKCLFLFFHNMFLCRFHKGFPPCASNDHAPSGLKDQSRGYAMLDTMLQVKARAGNS